MAVEDTELVQPSLLFGGRKKNLTEKRHEKGFQKESSTNYYR